MRLDPNNAGTVTCMRLFMDARYTRTDFHDGISRYGASLIAATAEQADVTMVISDEAQLRLLPAGIPWVKVSAPTSPREPWVSLELNAHRPDVVFSPMQTMGSFGRDHALILTLHDLIYYQHRTPPRDLPGPVRLLWRAFHLAHWPQRLVLDRADAVATVSRTTQRLMRRHRLTSREIRVIGNAPPAVDSPRAPEQHLERSLVYMGSFMDYKNVQSLIHALPHLPGFTLHLLSRITPDREQELRELADGLGVDESAVVFHRGVSDEEYVTLLRQCTALVTLSRAEGYGLPVAEAMSQGTPVVLSDLEIFREIGGEEDSAARYVRLDPDDAVTGRSLAAQVRRLEDPQVFAAASRAAVEQAGTFSWQESARRLVQLAEQLHARRRRR